MIPAAEFVTFGLICLISGFALGRISKPTRKVVEIVGFTRGPGGKFQKAITR